jgi:hypothetical protein
MQQNRQFLYVVWLLAMLTSCIKPYTPDIRLDDQIKYVVNGQINDSDVIQTINISKTSPIDDPAYIPVEGCSVIVQAETGESFDFFYNGNGDYQGHIPSAYLTPGKAFKLEIITPEGDNITSDFDRMSEGPSLGEVYWEVDTLFGNQIGDQTTGIQFYVDLEAEPQHSRYYRWESVETWEYHADYPLQWYYDGSVHRVEPPDYSRKICWNTQNVPYVFSINTNNLSDNRFLKFPLHFVSSRTSRLAYGYSVNIKQYTLSDEAYRYWEQMRLNNEQDAGLFEKQPVPVRGNLHYSSGDKEVLGFFGVSSMRSKRLFIFDSGGVMLDFSTFCNPSVLERAGFKEIRPYEYPAYLMGDDETYYMVVLNEECVNCLALGGINVKPDFWPR